MDLQEIQSSTFQSVSNLVDVFKCSIQIFYAKTAILKKTFIISRVIWIMILKCGYDYG